MISYTNHTCGVNVNEHTRWKVFMDLLVSVYVFFLWYLWTVTVGEKGQIVIPKQARDLFGIKPGDSLLLLGDEQRGIAIPPKGAFADLFGVAFQEKEGEGK